MVLSGEHIANINKILKNIKLEIIADLICTDQQSLTITTNKVISQSNLNTIEIYIKNVDAIELENIMTPCLSQSKFYLKIIGMLYIIKDTNIPINSSIVETIIKSMHIFNNMCLASKPHVIKALSKSDIVVI